MLNGHRKFMLIGWTALKTPQYMLFQMQERAGLQGAIILVFGQRWRLIAC